MLSSENLWTVMALGKPLDLVVSHLPRCKPSSCFSSEDFMILKSPPVVSAKLPGAKGQKQSCAEGLVLLQPSPALER